MRSSRTLNRRELYDLVWSKPMTEVSADLGISDRGLAKICSRHRVPSPPRGYWAQVAAGQMPRKPPFLKIRDKDLENVIVSETLSALPPEVADVVRQAREDGKARRAKAFNADDFALGQVSIPGAMVATAKALRSSKPGEDGEVRAIGDGLCGITVHYTQAERSITFLAHLAHELSRSGLEILPTGKTIQVKSKTDNFEFTLTERTRIERHEPTSDEVQRQLKRDDQLARAQRRGDWSNVFGLSSKVWRPFDTIYTGELVVAIKSWGGNGLRKKWADGKTQTIEKLLLAIADGFRAFLAAQKADREARDEQKRQWEHLEQRRSLAKQRKDREEKRIAHIRRIVEMQREARDIQRWLSTLPADATAFSGTELGRMIEWALARLSQLERQATLDAAAAAISGANLFPEVDDLFDPEGDLPAPRWGY